MSRAIQTPQANLKLYEDHNIFSFKGFHAGGYHLSFENIILDAMNEMTFNLVEVI